MWRVTTFRDQLCLTHPNGFSKMHGGFYSRNTKRQFSRQIEQHTCISQQGRLSVRTPFEANALPKTVRGCCAKQMDSRSPQAKDHQRIVAGPLPANCVTHATSAAQCELRSQKSLQVPIIAPKKE